MQRRGGVGACLGAGAAEYRASVFEWHGSRPHPAGDVIGGSGNARVRTGVCLARRNQVTYMCVCVCVCVCVGGWVSVVVSVCRHVCACMRMWACVDTSCSLCVQRLPCGGWVRRSDKGEAKRESGAGKDAHDILV